MSQSLKYCGHLGIESDQASQSPIVPSRPGGNAQESAPDLSIGE
jgi:hypothetical protein